MIPRRGSAKRKHEARVVWLTARPDLMIDVPGINDDVTDENRPRLMALVRMMDDRGLLGKTNNGGPAETVRRLISELRGQSVGAAHW